MAARAPSERQSSLPKSWDEMHGIEDSNPTPAKSSTPVPSAQKGTAASSQPVLIPVARKQHSPNPNLGRYVPSQQRSFWREHKNLVLTGVVILCPTLSLLVLLVLSRSMHPIEGKYYEGRTITEWVSLLGTEDPMERSQAFDMVVKLGDESISVLARALRDPEVERRRDAALAMQKIRPKDKKAVEALAGALQDKDLFVRWRAAQALRAMGPDASAAVSALAAALTDDDPRVRCAAAQALGKIGREAAIAQPALLSAMKDERAYVRQAASAALENIMTEVSIGH
jgi:hypothetical protein